MTEQIHLQVSLACMLSLSLVVSSMADEVKDENARKCINTRALNRTEIVDDSSILFFMGGKTVYLNILPRKCGGLSREGRFSYSISLGRLCNLDSIRLLQNSGSGLRQGRFCRLGYFHPIPKEDVAAIKDGSHNQVESAPIPPAEIEDITEETDGDVLEDSTLQ